MDNGLRTIIPAGEMKVHIQHWRGDKLLWERQGGDHIGTPGRTLLSYRIGTSDGLVGSIGGPRRRYIRASAIGTGVEAKGTPQGNLGYVIYHGTAPFAISGGSFAFNRSFSIGSSYAMRESGLFIGTRKDAALRGTMYCRGTFPVRNVAPGDTVTLNYRGGFISG